MKTLVLAAGRTFNELSQLIPQGSNRVLLRIAGKPVVCHTLSVLKNTPVSQLMLVYRVGEEAVYQEAVKCLDQYLIPVKQEVGESTADAVLSASGRLGDVDHFMVVFGDLILDVRDVAQVVSTHMSEELDATVMAVPLDPSKVGAFGLVIVDEYGFAKEVLEKQPPGYIENAYIAGGVYILPTGVLDLLEKGLTLPQALNSVVKTGRVKVVYATRDWVDVGSAKDFLKATHIVLSKMNGVFIHDKACIEKTVVIKEPPIYVDENAYIDHHSVLKGPVYVGKRSFVGAHSFLRDYTNIENDVRVGAYGEIRFSNVQPFVYLHSRVLLMDSVVGENSLIESNVTVLNIPIEEEELPKSRTMIIKKPVSKVEKVGAVIGCNSKIAAGVVIKSGTVVSKGTVLVEKTGKD